MPGETVAMQPSLVEDLDVYVQSTWIKASVSLSRNTIIIRPYESNDGQLCARKPKLAEGTPNTDLPVSTKNTFLEKDEPHLPGKASTDKAKIDSDSMKQNAQKTQVESTPSTVYPLGTYIQQDDASWEEPPSQNRLVTIEKEEGVGLGISIKGGSENRMPIIISKVFAGMAADRSSAVRVGDAVLSVNGEDLRGASHDAAVRALKRCGPRVRLELRFLREATRPLLLRGTGETGGQAEELPARWPDDSLDAACRVPLAMARLLRGADVADDADDDDAVDGDDDDAERRLELRGPCGRRRCRLRAATAEQADPWFDALEAAVEAATAAAASGGCRRAGWLWERPLALPTCVDAAWRPVFCQLTDSQLAVWATAADAAAAEASAAVEPLHRHDLLATRLLLLAPPPAETPGGRRGRRRRYFATRSGGPRGVESHAFAVASAAALAAWTEAASAAVADAVASRQMPLILPCRFDGADCRLTLDADGGFRMLEAAGGARAPRQLWAMPLEALRASADDGERLVWLDFGAGEGEGGGDGGGCGGGRRVEVDLLACPKPFVFALHNVLSCKLRRCGAAA